MATSYESGRSAGALLALVAAFFVWAAARAVIPSSTPGRASQSDGPPRIVVEAVGEDAEAIVVLGVDADVIASLARDDLSQEQWRAVFAVRTDDPEGGDDDQPQVLGRYSLEEGGVVFRPRFPLAPGTTYGARFEPEGAQPLESDLLVPMDDGPTTRVLAVYPTASVVPVNLLKMYVHFSAPMRFGEAYTHIRLRDSNGEVVPDAILEVLEEPWDPERRRLTLLFDPGRIKRDLEPNLTLGLPLREGESYVLEIDADWRDGLGRPLAQGFTKAFSVSDADRATPDPSRWTLIAPTAGSRDAVEIVFPEPMDRALLDHMIAVIAPAGSVLEGRVEVDAEESAWRFLPDVAWQAGEYTLDVDPDLEDLAGNNLAHLFDVDLAQDVRLSEAEARARLPFTVR